METEEEGLQCKQYRWCFHGRGECKGPGTLERQASLCDRGTVCKRKCRGKKSEISRPPSLSWIDKVLKVEDLEGYIMKYLGNEWWGEPGLGFWIFAAFGMIRESTRR